MFSANIKIVTVPGHGTMPAPKTTPQSVLCDFEDQPEQPQVKGWAENETVYGVFCLVALYFFIAK